MTRLNHGTPKIFFLAVVLVAITAYGEQAVEELPGYYPVEEIDIFASEEVVNIDLSGAMVAMVAAATEQQDPGLSELMASIRRIRVVTGPLQDTDPGRGRAAIHGAAQQLEAAGWSRNVKVEEDDEEVLVYSKEGDGLIQGLTVLVLEDGDEAVLVNISGNMDPALIGRMLGKLGDLDGLDELGDLGLGDYNDDEDEDNDEDSD